MTNHIYAGTSKIASIDGDGVLTYNHEDHLGSSSLRTDSSGNVVKNIVYSPFGNKRLESGSYNKIPYRFTGQYEDAESGLHYYRQRYYDSTLSRFVSADPLYLEEMDARGVDTQSLNLFAYVRNAPLMMVDPEGELGVKLGIFAGVDSIIGRSFSKGIAINYDSNSGEFTYGFYDNKSTSLGAKAGVGFGGEFSINNADNVKQLDGVSGGFSLAGDLKIGAGLGVAYSEGTAADDKTIREITFTPGYGFSAGIAGNVNETTVDSIKTESQIIQENNSIFQSSNNSSLGETGR